MTKVLQLLTENVVFGEAPRWHNGVLWFSDIKGHAVKTISLSGDLTTILNFKGEPSGLGWLPNGDLLVVSMIDHRLMRYSGDTLVEHANLSDYCGGKMNDLVVDKYGHAFISNIGFDYESGEEIVTTNLIRVDPDGTSHVAAEGIWSPNGMGITQDGNTLIVGQSASTEVLAFTLASDGSLSNRRVYVELPQGSVCDGMCVDREDAVWIASPISHMFLRLVPGLGVVDKIMTDGRHAIACMLGGEDRRTLFCMTAAGMSLSMSEAQLQGRIETVRVEVPGAGLP